VNKKKNARNLASNNYDLLNRRNLTSEYINNNNISYFDDMKERKIDKFKR
jgi:hypothetical protein